MHDVALTQLQVTTAALPQAGRAPNEAVHDGAPPAPVHETDAEAVPVVPPAPTALMVQRSPAAPTGYAPEPAHGTGPLDGVVPVQV